MHRPVLITPPASTPVSLEDMKLHLRVDNDLEDTLIEALIRAATGHLEGWTGILGICIAAQSWRQDFDRFDRKMCLALGPVNNIQAVRWRNSAGQIMTVSQAEYGLVTDAGGVAHLRFRNAFQLPSDLYERAAVQIEYSAGWSAEDIPAALKVAICLFVGAWYENREDTAIGVSVSSLPASVAAHALIDPYKKRRL